MPEGEGTPTPPINSAPTEARPSGVEFFLTLVREAAAAMDLDDEMLSMRINCPTPNPASTAEAAASSRDIAHASMHPELTLTVVVLGASGDLAKKKTFPALYTLFARG